MAKIICLTTPTDLIIWVPDKENNMTAQDYIDRDNYIAEIGAFSDIEGSKIIFNYTNESENEPL